MPMTRCCAALLLLVLVLTGSLGRAQDSEIITVTGLYITNPPGREYEKILTPCDSHEVWDVGSIGTAFTALAQAYASAETRGQLTKYGELFVELRGRYTAYTGESHSDGIFGVTELVRHSTAAADITACGSECEDIYGADAPTCLAEVDGQCGRPRNSCVSGDSFDSDVWLGTTDTATYYRWTCMGEFGGDSVICTAPKPVLGEGAGPPVTARSLWDLNWSEAPPAAIQALLDQGADAKARDRSGTTPLHWAAGANRNPAVAALLLDRGADLQARTRGDCLHFLAGGPFSHDLQARLRGRDGLVDHAGTTPLHCAAGANRNPAVVALLLDRGADLTVSNEHGTTPLHFAAAGNANPAVAALLLDRGAAINARDDLSHTPLHLAVRHNEAPVVALLLDRGAAVDARNDFGHTPLHSVTVRAAVPSAVVALLLDRGAAVNARDAILGETPLHYVAGRSKAIPAVAALLLDRGAAVDARNDFGHTPLHLAARHNGTPAMVALLLDRGADATLRDSAGKLPIDYVRGNAALKGTDIYRRLKDGARIDQEATAHHPIDIENLKDHDQRRVWVPFHFIPGNIGTTYTERLKCRMDSPVVQEMRDYHLTFSDRAFAPLKHFKQNLVRALRDLEAAGAIQSFEIRDALVHVRTVPSPSQRKHLAARRPPARRRK